MESVPCLIFTVPVHDLCFPLLLLSNSQFLATLFGYRIRCFLLSEINLLIPVGMGRSTSTSGVVLLLFLSALCFTSVVQAQLTHPEELKALRAVKLSLNDPMKFLSNWNHGDPCNSSWTGVFCYNQQRDDGYLHLLKLQLMNKNLSGTLSPDLGKFSQLKILNFMWNNLGGSIPGEIGNLKNLVYLFLCGNQLTGPLPDNLGNLTQLMRMHIDVNNISGPLPKSFANLDKLSHLHLNNNSISGEIPRELSRLPSLLHFGLDNNNLSGSLPAELSEMPNVVLFQLDNNNFSGSEIPTSYGDMTTLVKLSLRNCNLQGSVPDFSSLTNLSYIDLSLNQLSGPIPSEKLADSMTTIILSHNYLDGTIPENFSRLPRLQKLALDHNLLSGSVPSSLWQSRRLNAREILTLDFRENKLIKIVGNSSVLANVTLLLEGNLLCSNISTAEPYCGSLTPDVNNTQDTNLTSDTYVFSSSICPPPYECAPTALVSSAPSCYCAAPLIFYYRLESPGFAEFLPYQIDFEKFMASGLSLNVDQLNISSIVWQEGPRLKLVLKLFPAYENVGNNHIFNMSEVQRLWAIFTEWKFPRNDTFGPYELLEFIVLDPYKADFPQSTSLYGLSKGAFAGIIVGTISVAVVLSAVVLYLIIKMHSEKKNGTSKRYKSFRIPIEVEGVRRFTYEEMALATSQYSSSVEIGQGGYGKVYKGVLADGAPVAIKRAQEGSLQGVREFCTEIKILSRLHHRHLVSLVGYCDDKDEQMLVYEFMPNGTLRDHLSAKSKQPLSFATRLRIALGSARGILYLHSEADPPIFHGDVKTTNILLDSKFTAKVADFGLSRLAPEPDIDGIVPTHVSTVVKGTPGYLDPQYFFTHKFTDKSDVYGLGVVFLELLTAMQPISFRGNIVGEVYTAYKSGNVLSIVDERIGTYPHKRAERFATLALRCCQGESTARPAMAEVVRELEAIMQVTPEPYTSSTIEYSYSSPSKGDQTPSSSSAMKNTLMSYGLSSSDLVSGRFPEVGPR